MSLYTPDQFSKTFESKPKVWEKPEDAEGFNFNHSNFKLPLIRLEDVKKMDDKQIATHLTNDDTLRKTYEAKGYKWNEAVEKIKDIDRDGKTLWLVLGSPTGKALRSYIGLNPDVLKQMNLRINPAAGPGFRAIRTLKAQQNGQSRRKSRSKKVRKSRSKKVRKTRRV
jgi:hypothetical protein